MLEARTESEFGTAQISCGSQHESTPSSSVSVESNDTFSDLDQSKNTI